MNTCTVRAVQIRGSEVRAIVDSVNREDAVSLYVNDRLFATLVASRDQLRELGAGFVVCEGLADRVEHVEARGTEVRIRADIPNAVQRGIGSSGGIDILREPRRVASSLRIDPEMVFAVTEAIVSDVWRETGGVHTSVLFSEGELVATSSDVGRHNTVDKVVGHALLNGIDLSRCVIGCTGRQPRGMVSKAANAGVPIVISKAASTDRGISTAEETGVTLICFAREGRFTVYTHPERIIGL
ncbi:MAG: formate dehydrogenase accessory sulfurtransferase FdhD [Methanomicrobiales archaeon]|nr:formate dehydrogenase accessory sulfurtransferase FdhD [Methanomicrobiales archaeon]MDI6875324.1 formate dehydrogenase accessory sulfurtransferase FdhD [Methanomicrobiales archaeon]